MGKNGPKLQRTGDSAAAADSNSGESTSAALRLDNASLAKLCDALSRDADRPVVDVTGIPGTFDFNLRYRKSWDTAGPTLSSALERQLGLKLEPKKGPVDVLIIDHAVRAPVAPQS